VSSLEKEKEKHPIGSTERKVFPIGQSVAITLPKDFVEAHGIREGDSVVISYNSFLLLEPKDKAKILTEMKEKRSEMVKE